MFRLISDPSQLIVQWQSGSVGERTGNAYVIKIDDILYTFTSNPCWMGPLVFLLYPGQLKGLNVYYKTRVDILLDGN